MTTEIMKNASPRLPRPDAYARHVERILSTPPPSQLSLAYSRTVLFVLDFIAAVAYWLRSF